MKSITTSFILFFTVTVCIVVGQDSFECPNFTTEQLKKCTCYKASKYLMCKDLDENWKTSFKPDKLYNFDTFVITQSPKLPLWSEHFLDKEDGTLKNGITFKSLIFNSTIDKTFTKEALEELITLASEKIEIKIISSVPPTKQLVIDFKKFKNTLTSISLSNLKLINFENIIAPSVKLVTNLFLDNVAFESEKSITIIQPTALTRIEINNSPSLSGSFKYSPQSCKAEQQIEIILKNNKKLTGFDTSGMFINENCKYYVDLTGSGLKDDYLVTNDLILKNDPKKAENLFIIFRDISLTCDFCVQQWYSSRKTYVHSILCKDKPEFIDEILLKNKYTKVPNVNKC